jgi:hypothetical protein
MRRTRQRKLEWFDTVIIVCIIRKIADTYQVSQNVCTLFDVPSKALQKLYETNSYCKIKRSYKRFYYTKDDGK